LIRADDLGQRQHVGDPLGQEQPDHVAVGRPDLLADDDPQAQVTLGCLHGRRGHVVVGDADQVEAGLAGPFGQLIERQHRVAGRDRVQMAVNPHPPGRGHDTHPTRSLLSPRTLVGRFTPAALPRLTRRSPVPRIFLEHHSSNRVRLRRRR
jgi:hypothetical protein